MKKLARNTLALGTATLIVTAALSFSANGADAIVAKANSSAITATGLTGIVDSKTCTVESTGPATEGTDEICGTGLSVSGTAVGAVDQTASTDLDGKKGTSTASAGVASVGLPALTTLDLSDLQGSLSSINTGTILDGVLQGLDPITKPLFEAVLTPALAAIQTAVVTPLTTALQGSLPVAVEIGAVNSTCSAVAGATPTMSSTVAGISIKVTLPAPIGDIVIPLTLNTSPNAAIIGPDAPQELVDGILDGVVATLNTSLNGVLGPLAAVVTTLQTTLVDAVLDQLGPALLAPLGDALEPIVQGTVNKQVTNADGSVEVTALDLNLLGNTARTAIARSNCGPNATVAVTDDQVAAVAAADDSDAPADVAAADDSDANADADADADANADTVADADAQADADVTTTLPSTGAPNLLPFWLLGIALLLFGGAVLLNEKRRLNQI